MNYSTTTQKLIGFIIIVHVSLMYTTMDAYLKGVYLTLNLWRKGRDTDGWLTTNAQQRRREGKLDPDHNPPD